MNGFDYGEIECYYSFCATMNYEKFKSKSGKKIYCQVHVSHYTDDYNPYSNIPIFLKI